MKMNKKLCDVVVGKTIVSVGYLSHEVVTFRFSDDTFLTIVQPSQSGALDVFYLDNLVAHEIDADDKENQDERCG